MENIMLSHTLTQNRNSRFRMLGLGLGLAVAILANFGDRAFMASAANNGIDPLQILDTSVKNNILFLVSTSESLSGTPETAAFPYGVGGDDPASRFYQVKRAVRDFVANNQSKANFGVAAFHPEVAEHVIENTNGLVYVTQDNSAPNYVNFFNRSGGSVLAIFPGAVNSDTLTNSATHTTTSYTPAANSLLVLFVVSSTGTFSNVTGHGLAAGSYTQVGSTVNAGGQSMSLWVAKAGATPTSAGASVTVSATRPVSMVEYYVNGADLSGGTALSALAQNVSTTGTGTAASTTLAAAAGTGSGEMYFVSHNANEGTTFALGWTEGSDTAAPSALVGPAHTQGSSSNDAGVESQYNLTFSTAASAQWATSKAWGAFAIEIKAAPAPALIDSCAGALCTSTESAGIFDDLQTNDAITSTAYPTPCTPQLLDQVAIGGLANAPITHVLGTNCRYYARTKIFLSNSRFTINRLNPPSSAVVAGIDITCPNPPPGLVGDDLLTANDGTKARACFELQDAVTGKITTYWLT